LLGHPEWISDPRFETNVTRVANKVTLDALVSEAIANDNCVAWLARLQEAGIPSAPILTIPEVIEAPQTSALDILSSGEDHPSLRLVRAPLSFDGRRPAILGTVCSPGQNDAEFP
jgi:crotonobetainyl-CoA:carnitine CoA-transferase CaiB-like acyl-CoA transferase